MNRLTKCTDHLYISCGSQIQVTLGRVELGAYCIKYSGFTEIHWNLSSFGNLEQNPYQSNKKTLGA